MSKDEEEQFA